MNAKNSIFSANGLALRTGALLVMLSITQQLPVLARAQDDAVFARLQAYKAQLSWSENQTWKDVDTLRWQMRDIKDQTDLAIMQKRLDNKMRDLDRIRMDLADINQRLM
jgi:hypothetical protein